MTSFFCKFQSVECLVSQNERAPMNVFLKNYWDDVQCYMDVVDDPPWFVFCKPEESTEHALCQ